jgi:MFS family permease
MFQTIFGWNPIKSGAVVLFIFVGNIGIKPATTPLLRRFGFRTILVASAAGLTVTMAAAGLISGGTPVAVVAIICLASGVARSVTLTANISVGLSEVTPAQLPDANSLSATAQQLSLGIAVAVAAILLRAGQSLHGAFPGPRSPFVFAFAVLAAVAILAALGAARLDPHTGAHVSRRPQPEAEPS